MTHKRRQFKSVLKKSRRQQRKRINDELALSYGEKNFTEFWRRCKTVDVSKAVKHSDLLDGVTGEPEISNHWAQIYTKLFNVEQSRLHEPTVQKYIEHGKNNNYFRMIKCEEMLDFEKFEE